LLLFQLQKKSPKRNRPQSHTVYLGTEKTLEDEDVTVFGLGFYPNRLTVATGDVIKFKSNSREAHLVGYSNDASFQDTIVPPFQLPTPAPYVFDGVTAFSSSFILEGGEISVSVTAPAGTYKLRCVIHPLMTFFLTVVERNGGPEPKSKAKSASSSEEATWQMQLDLSKGTYIYNQAVTEVENGFSGFFAAPLTGYEFVAVGAGDGHTALMSFIPSTLDIAVGTTVRFVNLDPFVPHTVSYILDPLTEGTVFGTPGDVHLATGFSSAWLFPLGVGIYPNAVNQIYYDVTFNEAGTYEIICEIHDEIGMSMYITVS